MIFQLLKKIAPECNWQTRLFQLFENNQLFLGKEMGFQADWREDRIWTL